MTMNLLRRVPLIISLAALTVLAGMVPAVAVTGKQSAAPAVATTGMPVRSCESLTALGVPNTKVDSATTVAATSSVPGYCDVQLTVNNPPSTDAVNVGVFLPMSTWNGRFEGVGGGVYETGDPSAPDSTALQAGYATAATDGGHANTFTNTLFGAFALNPDNTLNTQLINDFSFIGIHEMTTTAKAVIAAYYGTGPRYSYFNGCSTGGRQGLMEAQRYPADYNGIAAGSPAINWTKFIPSELWPELVMLQSHDFLPSCKEQAFTNAVIAACADASGVIENPAACHWNPFRLVGEDTPCGTITPTDAAVVEKIWDGPIVDGKHLWYGLEPGASLLGLAATTTSNGTTGPSAFPVSVGWFQYWLTQNPNFNWETLTYQQFVQYFNQSVSEWADTIATDNPNLSAFERDGGKILIWHGLADQLIFPQGTINYYQRVQDTLGAANTATFARLFLAPGAQHCTAAAGPAPTNLLQSVVNWVEHGQAPATLPASGGSTNHSPQLCMYPYMSTYVSGDPNNGSSYACVRLTPGKQRQLTALY
ncbi:MAG TPA: tannase/feruloyl esterase family alpha/beta hydrolase [Trebonia sp.]|jgi:feruloyl esterase